jgi:hypothetical protein
MDHRGNTTKSVHTDAMAIWYLFLDIDGVLNSNRTRTLLKKQRPGCTAFEAGTPSAEHLRLLRRLVDGVRDASRDAAPVCHIVLSSSWRLEEKDKRDAIEALATVDLVLSGETPDLCARGKSRVDEICSWLEREAAVQLDEHEGGIRAPTGELSPPWLALDDMALLNYDPEGTLIDEEHFEMTVDAHGLTEHGVASAVAKLSRQPELRQRQRHSAGPAGT